MDMPMTFAFRLDAEVDPAQELGVVEARRTSDGAPTLRVWNVEHAAYVCEHEPTHREAMHWFEHGATADEPPCAHCASGPYPRCAPGSERAAKLRTQLWRVPATARAVLALIGVDDPPEKRPATADVPEKRKKKRTRTEKILENTLNVPPEILVQILFRLDARDLLSTIDVNRQLRALTIDVLRRLPGVLLCGVMLHAARNGRRAILNLLTAHQHFGAFAPAALQVAAEAGPVSVVSFLLNDGHADPVDNWDMRPLLNAVWHDRADVVERLKVALGLLPRSPGTPFWAPRDAYIMAAQRGNLEIMEMLLGMRAYTLVLPPHGPVPAPVLEQAMVAASRGAHPAVLARLVEVATRPQLGDRPNVGRVLAGLQLRGEILAGEQADWHSSVAVEQLLRGLRLPDDKYIPVLLRGSIRNREHAETMLYIDYAMKPENAQFLSLHRAGLLREAAIVTVHRPRNVNDTLVAVSLLAATGTVNDQLEETLTLGSFRGNIVEPFVREWLEFVRQRREVRP